MISVTKVIKFDAAHRIVGHKGGCQFLHGHSYLLEASFSADKLNELGMVIDFAVIKEKLGNWIKQNWDHNAVLFSQDKKLGLHIEEATGQKVFFMEHNPTCENMALFLFNKVCPDLFKDYGIKCSRIKLFESAASFSEVGV
jgi:6-pyruvoyltetrahydropterin/6-carboxytetrahydropterin synthase